MRIFPLLLVLGLLSACKTKEATTQASAAKTMRQLKWLCGTWINETEKGTLYEVWTANGASEYNGFSFFISGNDTLFSESIKLIRKGDQLLYVPMVKNQNNGKSVEFSYIQSPKNSWIFENTRHDFPQRIIYRHPASDSLFARIEGVQEGRFSAEDFIMTRKN